MKIANAQSKRKNIFFVSSRAELLNELIYGRFNRILVKNLSNVIQYNITCYILYQTFFSFIRIDRSVTNCGQQYRAKKCLCKIFVVHEITLL